MTVPSSSLQRTEAQIWRYGRRCLDAGLVLSVALVALVAVKAPTLTVFLPLTLLAGIAGWWLFRRPLINLAIVLGSFVLIADFEPGLEVKEIVYALYYVTFLATWYFKQLFVYREQLVKTSADFLVLFVISWVTLYAVLSFLYPGDHKDVVNELQAWSMLAFYFPVKYACSRYPSGAKVVLVTVVIVGLFVVARNMLTLQQQLSEATAGWQVTRKGRVVTNEMLMIVPVFGMLALTLVAESLGRKAVLFGLFLVLLFGLIMTQGRGYWLSFAFGSLVLLFVLRRRERVQLVSMSFLGIAVCILVILLAFGDLALLIWAGLWSRVLSIGSAASNDISLINRFLEWKSALKDIAENPVMGYGMARKIRYYDITISGTRTRTWIHNGYISLWYQFGIIGLLSVVSLTVVSIRNGFKVLRTQVQDPFVWSAATMAGVSLTALLVSTIPSNAWFVADTLLYFGVTCGIAAGCAERIELIEVREG